MKIIPPGMTFEQALRGGHAGRILSQPYLDWLKTLPCDTCGWGAPSDPSHINSFKGMGTKAPDLMAIPQCRNCHELYERGEDPVAQSLAPPLTEPPERPLRYRRDQFLARCAIYLIRAYWEGRLVWRKD